MVLLPQKKTKLDSDKDGDESPGGRGRFCQEQRREVGSLEDGLCNGWRCQCPSWGHHEAAHCSPGERPHQIQMGASSFNPHTLIQKKLCAHLVPALLPPSSYLGV